MTLYGIDVSNHQREFDFAAAKAEGFAFATHKVTEGHDYKDDYWPRARDQMVEHFPGLFGGYVFCRRASHPEREADTLLAHLGDPRIPVQLDYEDTSGGGSISDLRARIKAIEDRGMRVFANYLPRWFWRDRMGAPSLAGTPALWNSHYVVGDGYASTLYETSPGTTAAGWAPFHEGAPPISILQFTEKARVAGQSIDANAFRGTADDLRALFHPPTPEAPEGVPMSYADEELKKKFPSRSKYRTNDEPVDTLAGMVLNTDARIHERFIEEQALKGVQSAIDLVRREAAKGDPAARSILTKVGL